MKTLAALVLLVLAVYGVKAVWSDYAHGAEATKAQQQINEERELVRSSFRGAVVTPLFAGDKREATFFLHTSWIPGSDKSGSMRYKAEAAPSNDAGPEANALFLIKASHCKLAYELIDAQGFKLRTIPLEFLLVNDDKHQVESIEANGTIPMSKDEYISIAKESSFSTTWHCPYL